MVCARLRAAGQVQQGKYRCVRLKMPEDIQPFLRLRMPPGSLLVLTLKAPGCELYRGFVKASAVSGKGGISGG